MFKNYLKIALRSARRQGGITLLNIVGLANGIARFVDSYQAIKTASANPIESLKDE
jgi:hypothetical protein